MAVKWALELVPLGSNHSSITSCVPLHKLLNVSVPKFRENGENKRAHFIYSYCKFKGVSHIKPLCTVLGTQ